MEDKLIVTVELKSGKFHSKIEVPLFASDDTKQHFIEAWLQLIETGIRAGRSSREHQEGKTFTNQENLEVALNAVRSQTGYTMMTTSQIAEALMLLLTKTER